MFHDFSKTGGGYLGSTPTAVEPSLIASIAYLPATKWKKMKNATNPTGRASLLILSAYFAVKDITKLFNNPQVMRNIQQG